MALLDKLNPAQRDAVLATEGPVLVLAGAGSGKTRVVTYRIAHLIEQGVPPRAILAVTFTNKAAAQMRERVDGLLSGTGGLAADVWISTFHSFCARLLRREAPRLGLKRDFAIFDEDDQTAAVKLALRQLGFDEKSYTPRSMLERISFAKNRGLGAEALAGEPGDELGRAAASVFEGYQAVLKQAGALDFDDLLIRGVEALRDHAEAREQWQARFRYLHVDEYQDVNPMQYEVLRSLTGPEQNVCVVGDEDQSIYSWRGADVRHILRFTEDFPGAKLIRLEENYRSMQTILDAAGAVVAHNERRIGKELRATRGAGPLLRFFEARDAVEEAIWVAEEIERLLLGDTSTHVAVLYRTSAVSRLFEEVLQRKAIRYQLLGGFSFYHRAEVKDALAYLRIVRNPDDDISLLRVINTPPRGIGKTTVEALRAAAGRDRSSLWTAIEPVLAARSAGASAPLREFRKLIEGLRKEAASLAPAELLTAVLDRTGYLDQLEQQDTVEDSARADNLRELMNAVAEATESGETFQDFLDRAALVSDADQYDESAQVTLSTLHSIKGLEFEHVFIAGLEEGLFPHARALRRPEDLEEERRLCYVGMTRAKDTLALTRAVYRRSYGSDLEQSPMPSRFLMEIPGELIESAEGSLAEAGETRRYVPDPETVERQFLRRFPARGSTRERAARSAASHAPRTASRGRATSNPLLGVRVRHKTYGIGTIIGVDGEDEERRLTVSFPDHGTKKLVERYANLERV